MRRGCHMAAAGFAAILVAGCGSDTGFVEIKILPGFAVPALSIDKEPLALKSGTVILRRKIGSAKLETDSRGNLIAFCDFTIRKNRITTVSVSSTGRELRCRVQS